MLSNIDLWKKSPITQWTCYHTQWHSWEPVPTDPTELEGKLSFIRYSQWFLSFRWPFMGCYANTTIPVGTKVVAKNSHYVLLPQRRFNEELTIQPRPFSASLVFNRRLFHQHIPTFWLFHAPKTIPAIWEKSKAAFPPINNLDLYFSSRNCWKSTYSMLFWTLRLDHPKPTNHMQSKKIEPPILQLQFLQNDPTLKKLISSSSFPSSKVLHLHPYYFQLSCIYYQSCERNA